MDTSLGQEKPEAQIAKQPAIKVQTTLVMVPAIVTDRSGSHVEKWEDSADWILPACANQA
jgi:hypothetical protein